ncbi:hypothetical protein EDD99_7271 [Streptomyces sp. 846.5]|nr:SCO2322 family protein [Streptomyces sp. 846.5]TDT95441.1 hypothetical protein EDD99_7271 [Streptomyces sp. 846.5]
MRPRRIGAVAGLLATALLLVLAAVTPASASSYRYWSFWQGSAGGWTLQQSAPNANRPADGSVDGWRFGINVNSAAAAKPGAAPDFATACADTPAVSGKKRVAVVIDYGVAGDVPAGSTLPHPTPFTACAVLPTDATSDQLLARVAPPLRYDSNGILCAVGGYPTTGCGVVVTGTAAGGTTTAAPKATSKAAPAKSSKTAGWIIGAVLLAALAGAGYWQTRRRRPQ